MQWVTMDGSVAIMATRFVSFTWHPNEEIEGSAMQQEAPRAQPAVLAEDPTIADSSDCRAKANTCGTFGQFIKQPLSSCSDSCAHLLNQITLAL